MKITRAIAALLSATLAGCHEAPAAKQTAPAPAKVTSPVKEAELNAITLTPETEARLGIKVEAVARRSVPKVRVVGGELVVPPGMTLDVSAPVAGTLAEGRAVPAAGQTVRRGEPLFRIVPLLPADRDLRISAERDLAAARAALQAAQQKVARSERLVADGTGSRRSLEEARAELSTAEAAFNAATERMAVVNRSHISEANELVVPAPIDGVVELVSAAPGQPVAASAKLAQIARLDRLWVRVPLYSGEARAFNLDRGVEVLRLGDPPDAQGLTARRIAAPPSATPAASAVDLVFELPARAPFQPGERVLVRLAGRTGAAATVISSAALLHDIHGGTWVYERTADHVFSRRRVEVEHTVGGFAVLARGPQVGAAVVTVGVAELYGIEFGAGK